jgi:hypothetical protein
MSMLFRPITGNRNLSTLEEKRSEHIQESLAIIKSMPPNWQAHAWLLERVYRDHFQRDVNINIAQQNTLLLMQERVKHLVVQATQAKELEDAQKQFSVLDEDNVS